ncbi:MAG: molecular chaperone TorD family protein, partial [Acidobacteriota bacterium]
FECPVGGWREKVAAVTSEIADAELGAAAETAQAEATEGLYHSLFGPGGPVSAREVSYRESVELGHLMSELACYYGAFAYQPGTQEVDDHVAVEAGFVGYLRLKEAYALASGDAERAAVTAEAARRFIDDHLAAMAEPLAAALGASGSRYLATAAAALLRRTGGG